MRILLESQSPEDRLAKSLVIQEKLFGLETFQKGVCVCFYVSLPAEVDTHPMIERALRMGKRVVVPRVDLENKALKLYLITNLQSDLEEGTFGVMEPRLHKARPVDRREIHSVIVPGLAFDRTHHRLGRGAGFYDRFLGELGPSASKIGLAFSFQVVPTLPHESHDTTVDWVLTD